MRNSFWNLFEVVLTLTLTFVLACTLSNPLALFLSMSSIVLAFAFMSKLFYICVKIVMPVCLISVLIKLFNLSSVGSASSKYFEGVLFILACRPYNIGDLIHVSNVESEVSALFDVYLLP